MRILSRRRTSAALPTRSGLHGHLAFGAFAAFVAFATGCSSGDGLPSGADPGTLDGRGGASNGAGASSPLNGEWDVITSFNQAERVGTMVISPTRFSLAVVAFSVDADFSGDVPDVSGHLDSRSGPVTATHVAQPLDLGQIPFGLGGKWTVRGDSAGTCTGELASGVGTLDCSNLNTPMNRWFQGYDYADKKPLGTGTSTAQRERKLPSIFNELGGEWKVIMPWATCAVTFEDDHMDATCFEEQEHADGAATLSLRFGDGVATGTSNQGEMSARRR